MRLYYLKKTNRKGSAISIHAPATKAIVALPMRHCGKPQKSRAAISKRYRAKQRVFKRRCIGCGKEFVGNSEQKFCSISCGARNNVALKTLREATHKKRLEICLTHINMCKTKDELKRRYPSDYRYGQKNHLAEYIQLPKEPQIKKVYPKGLVLARLAECEKRARLCKTVGEFMRRFSNYYKYACSKGVHFPFLAILGVPRVYTDEYIEAVAKKFKWKKDFRTKEVNLYAIAKRRGLLPRFVWLKSQSGTFGKQHYVYQYRFRKHKAVYIGRTNNPTFRDKGHHKENSTVFKFAKEHGLDIPRMQILKKGLTMEESQAWEAEYVWKYRASGLMVLNKGAVGVGTGSVGTLSKASKKEVLRIAEGCDDLEDFRRNHTRQYRIALSHGWLKECELNRKRRKKGSLTKSFCVREAEKYSSYSEMLKIDASLYYTMYNEGWLELCPWLAHNQRLTKAYCLEVAKGYNSPTELGKVNSGVLAKLYQKGWIKECAWFPKRHYGGVKQFTEDGKLVGEYRTIMEASRVTGVGAANIVAVCKGYRPKSCGFVWKYA